MNGHSHKAGGLKQSNKKNKRTKASKRSIKGNMGGRVNKSSAGGKAVVQSKADRRHFQQQKRVASRMAVVNRKRGLDGGAPTPRVIGIISLGQEASGLEERMRSFLVKDADSVDDKYSSVTAKYEVHKKAGCLTILTNSTAFGPHYDNSDDSAILSALDLCRVCDMVLFVVDANGPDPSVNLTGMNIGGDDKSVSTARSIGGQQYDHLISERGDRVLSAIKAQGLPTPLTILAKTVKDEPEEDYMTMQSTKSIRRSALKRKTDLKQYIHRFATTEFGVEKDKVMEVDLTGMEEEGMDDDETEQQSRLSASAALVRTLCTAAASAPNWITESPRTYILSDSYEYSPERQELLLTGYIRGSAPFNVNSMLHIPNLGTFACSMVKKTSAPLSKKHGGMEEDEKVLESDPMKRENLEMFATPDALEGEQNLVGFDEEYPDEDDEEDDGNNGHISPAGWSDYQSSWLDGIDGDVSVGEGELDRGELAKALNQKSSQSVATGVMDMDDDDNEISPEEKALLLNQRRKDHKDTLEFPDEVEITEDLKAQDRLARYRSIKSFRKSYWDPKENLPEDYSQIYHFKSFRGTQRDVMADMKDITAAASKINGSFWGKSPETSDQQDMDDDCEDDDLLEACIPSGRYVTVTVERVSIKSFSQISSKAAIAAVALLPHENKVSVLHMSLSQSTNCKQSEEIPVKSKDVLTFRCGWRTWKGRPVFSQHNLNSDKHKFERFLPRGGAFFAASVYGPVTYTPCPVLVFRDGVSEERELVAIGSMLPADADRIVVKRIVLTGYPVRVHKRHATVKYMFYNPDDVNWFKPAGLVTKHGLNGNIIESVGEHGTMKCLFNAPIKQHDTVCLPLYKRIYPKFANTVPASDDGVSVRSSKQQERLVVL